ncbi:hypothetical protein FRC12_020324 [Ceratobasidium sp. 428]|nr:hypothetical protein FRC12_020324 [Ceratobasidium sp. 428]
MTSKPSKRDRLRGFLAETSDTFRDLFRSPSPTPSSSARSTRDVASAALRVSLKGLRKSSNMLPTLKSFVDILIDCFDNMPVAAKNRREYEELALSISASVKELQEHVRKVDPTRISHAVENVIEQMHQQAKYISEKQDRGHVQSYAEAETDIDDLIRCYRRIEALFRQLQSGAILSIWRIANDNWEVANEILTNARLQELNPAQMAIYDHSTAASQLGRRGCTLNTRQLVLQGLQDWACDPRGAKVYWMNGMAGTGKTTIAYSFCRALEASNQLAGSFFCSRLLTECREIGRIIPTVVSQLSHFCRPISGILRRVLENNPNISIRGVTTQFEKLIFEPLRDVKDTMPAGLPVVVLDALDECSDQDNARLFVGALLRFSQNLPIKFFVTCRPDTVLLGKLTPDNTLSHSLVHLHDVEESLVQADIETYLSDELEPLRATPVQIQTLTNRSGKLFIFAATVVRYIGLDDASFDHHRRMEFILGVTASSSSRMYAPLDFLYSAVLSTSLDNDRLESWEKECIRQVLHTVVCAKEPLSVETLTQLLQFASSNQTRQAIEPLRSVLHIDITCSPLHDRAGSAVTESSITSYQLSAVLA